MGTSKGYEEVFFSSLERGDSNEKKAQDLAGRLLTLYDQFAKRYRVYDFQRPGSEHNGQIEVQREHSGDDINKTTIIIKPNNKSEGGIWIRMEIQGKLEVNKMKIVVSSDLSKYMNALSAQVDPDQVEFQQQDVLSLTIEPNASCPVSRIASVLKAEALMDAAPGLITEVFEEINGYADFILKRMSREELEEILANQQAVNLLKESLHKAFGRATVNKTPAVPQDGEAQRTTAPVQEK